MMVVDNTLILVILVIIVYGFKYSRNMITKNITTFLIFFLALFFPLIFPSIMRNPLIFRIFSEWILDLNLSKKLVMIVIMARSV